MKENAVAAVAEVAAAPTESEAHAGPSYVKIWGLLLVLLVISVLGPMLEIPLVTLITAFGIAIVKAYLVVRYFMHLSVEPAYLGYLLAAMVAFVVLFYAGVAPDVRLHEGEQWVNLAARAEVDRALAAQRGPAGGPAVVEGPFIAAAEFESSCGICHGAGGGGDGPAAAGLDPHPANFTDAAFWATRDRDHVLRVVAEGGAAVGRSPLMPSFGARYDAEELAALVDHVIGLAPEGALPATAADAEGEDTVAPEATEGEAIEGEAIEGDAPAIAPIEATAIEAADDEATQNEASEATRNEAVEATEVEATEVEATQNGEAEPASAEDGS